MAFVKAERGHFKSHASTNRPRPRPIKNQLMQENEQVQDAQPDKHYLNWINQSEKD